MTISTEELEFDPMPSFGAINLETPTHINDLDEEEANLIRKTQAQLANLPTNLPTDARLAESLINRVSIENQDVAIQESYNELAQYKEEIKEASILVPFPHLAWEAIKVGLAKQDQIHDKLHQHIDEIDQAQKDISLLLDLSAELSNMKEDNKELSERAQSLLDQLKNRGMELNGETVGDIKRLTGSHESRLRSEIQIKFTTKVQYLMQQIESMMQILQNIIRNDSKLKEKANQLTR